MFNYSRKYTRVNRTIAEKLYNAGMDVMFIPCKLDPDNDFYNLGIWENNRLDGQHETFEKLCNAFYYYNCNAETGKYIAFYVSGIEKIDTILSKLKSGYVFGQQHDGYFSINLSLDPFGKYIRYSHFGSSAVKNNRNDLIWLLGTIFQMNPADFCKTYTAVLPENI